MTKLTKTLRVKREGQSDLVLKKGLEVSSSVVGKSEVLAYVDNGSPKQVVVAAKTRHPLLDALTNLASVVQKSSSYSKGKDKAVLAMGKSFEAFIKKNIDINKVDNFEPKITVQFKKLSKSIWNLIDKSIVGDARKGVSAQLATAGNAALLKGVYKVQPTNGNVYPDKLLPYIQPASDLFKAVGLFESGDEDGAKYLTLSTDKALRGVVSKSLLKWAKS